MGLITKLNERRKGLALDEPLLLVGIIFAAFVGVAVLTVGSVIGVETLPGSKTMVFVLRCYLMGPMM